MEIKELPDFRRDWNIADKNIDILEYVVHVADKFHPSFDGFDFVPSYDPITFNERYIERALTVQQRYERACSMGLTCSFEEYQQKQQYPFVLDADFKDRYSDEQLQNTIKAYGLDVSKLWYLIVYVNDYVKDLCVNAYKLDKPLLDELNTIKEGLSDASEIVLKSKGKKIYSTQKKAVIEILEKSLLQLINNYDNERDGLRTVNFNESETIEMSYRQYKFAEMMLYFLKDKKGKLQPNTHCKVYREKHFFVSMLLYVVGLYSDNTLSAKNKWYEPWYNDKENRNLSNLVKNYKNREFPHSVGKIYWK